MSSGLCLSRAAVRWFHQTDPGRLVGARGQRGLRTMSEERRSELTEEALARLDQLVLGLPTIGRTDFVKSSGRDSQWDRSWHFFAYSYCRAFDSLWDAAYARRSGTDYPLLFICRQSIELWLKVAISTLDPPEPPKCHDLSFLWLRLVTVLAERTGHSTGVAYPESVNELIQVLDEHDKRGDRFRYPIAGDQKPFSSTVADLDELYRAHELITGFCDAVHTQLEVERDLPY